MHIRALTPDDKVLIQDWIDKDPDHAGMVPDYFHHPNTETLVFEDEQGVIAFVRLARVLRIDVQFNPEARLRTARLLHNGFPWLMEMAKTSGYTQLIFDSVSEPLIRFCENKLGFEPSPNEFRLHL